MTAGSNSTTQASYQTSSTSYQTTSSSSTTQSSYHTSSTSYQTSSSSSSSSNMPGVTLQIPVGGSQATSQFVQSESTSFSTTQQSGNLSAGAFHGGASPASIAQQLVQSSGQLMKAENGQGAGTSVGSGGAWGVQVASGGKSVPGDASAYSYSVETPDGTANYAFSSSSEAKEIPGGFATSSIQKSSYSSVSTHQTDL